MIRPAKTFIRAIFIISACLGINNCDNTKLNAANHPSQIEWPKITHEMKPWTRWWWFGSAVNEKDLSAALEAYEKAGLGGVEITPIYGVRGTESQFIDFLSPKWIKEFIYTLDEAKRLNIGVDLANASGWPFGGPWIDESTAAKNVVSKVFTVSGGQSIAEKISYTQQPLVKMQSNKKLTIEDVKYPIAANQPLQENAFNQVRFKKELPLVIVTANKVSPDGFSQSINLTKKVINNKLVWTAPEGQWIVCALFQGDHGKMVERSGPGGEGLVIDHFSEQALQTYLNKFDIALRNQNIAYLRHFFNDSYEVDDALGEANWTPEFFFEFERINGYDLSNYLPALLGKDNENNNKRIIYDYRKTISELILDKYTRIWQKWATKYGKGIRNQSHGSPGNLLDLYAASDIPETEGSDIVNLKSASSAAHVTGKRLTSSESCTWLNEHFETTPGQVKSAIDNYLLAGINHIFYHGTAYSPQDASWPGWLFYAAVHFTPTNSLWQDFGVVNEYIARSQSFLQAGKPANDILVYCPVSDWWSESNSKGMLQHFDNFNKLSIKECGDYLTPNGYSWDAISDKQLQEVSYRNTDLYVGGNRYQTIIVPETKLIPVETFEKLINLAHAGATVLFYKNLPSDVPGLSQQELNRKKIKAIKGKLTFSTNGKTSVATYEKGKVVISDNLAELISKTKVLPESIYSAGLQCIRRIKDNGDSYYFIKNPASKSFEGWITLNATYNSAILYNPMTNEAGYAKTGDNKQIFVQIKPDASLIVETIGTKSNGKVYPYYKKDNNQSFTFNNEWKIEFINGGPSLPSPVKTTALDSWTTYGTEYEAFSGTAVYSTTIPSLPSKPDAWLLNIESVHESAAIYLNDKYIGTLISEPYSIEIPSYLFQGNDQLKIKVSNLMANRIADLDKRGIEWRKFYNTNFNARNKKNTGEDGKFTAINWEPKSSGIIGKVTFTPLSLMK